MEQGRVGDKAPNYSAEVSGDYSLFNARVPKNTSDPSLFTSIHILINPEYFKIVK